MEKLNRWKICICHFVLLSVERSFWFSECGQKCVREQNFQLQNPLKFGSAVFRVSMETENWCQPLSKIGEMAPAPQKHVLEQNSQLQTPLRFGAPVFRVSTETEIGVGHYEQLEKWL